MNPETILARTSKLAAMDHELRTLYASEFVTYARLDLSRLGGAAAAVEFAVDDDDQLRVRNTYVGSTWWIPWTDTKDELRDRILGLARDAALLVNEERTRDGSTPWDSDIS